MTKSAYDRWLKFISRPSSESGLTFPSVEARAIMAIPLERDEPDWRKYKRQVNKAAARARRSDGE